MPGERGTFLQVVHTSREPVLRGLPAARKLFRAKSKTAQSLVAYLIKQGVLSDGMRIAHIRSDVGSFMLAIQQEFPNCQIHGFDYFDSNIRYARAQGLGDVAELDPARLCLLEEPGYDLVICNHVMTHAFDPKADLKTLYRVIKPGGALFLYNEADHLLRFQPDSAHYQWVALNNFHKQLLTSHSLNNFY